MQLRSVEQTSLAHVKYLFLLHLIKLDYNAGLDNIAF